MKIIIGADLVPMGASVEGLGSGASSEQAFIDGNVELLFTDVLPLMQNADRTIVNLECALTTADTDIKKFGPNIKASPKCAQTLKKAGVTDVALANNHVFDFGKAGLEETLRVLDEAGLPYMGVGYNDTDSRNIYYIKEQGKTVAVVNVCEHEYTYALPDRVGANPFDPFLTMADIRTAKKNASCVIVLYHGGKEHCRYPSPRLRNACQEMANNGADVVIAQHSHCIGCYENYNGAHILYGQGNFHFAMGDRGELWNTGLVVELNIDKEVGVKFYPFESKGASITLAKGERYQQIMDSFQKRNEELLNGEWRKGWNAFCQSMRETYENVIFNCGQGETDEEKHYFVELFSHFLDCEAHTDVWRELFPTWNTTNEK